MLLLFYTAYSVISKAASSIPGIYAWCRARWRGPFVAAGHVGEAHSWQGVTRARHSRRSLPYPCVDTERNCPCTDLLYHIPFIHDLSFILLIHETCSHETCSWLAYERGLLFTGRFFLKG